MGERLGTRGCCSAVLCLRFNPEKKRRGNAGNCTLYLCNFEDQLVQRCLNQISHAGWVFLLGLGLLFFFFSECTSPLWDGKHHWGWRGLKFMIQFGACLWYFRSIIECHQDCFFPRKTLLFKLFASTCNIMVFYIISLLFRLFNKYFQSPLSLSNSG